MSIADELIQANEAYAASFDKGHLPVRPGKRVAVVACMDSRILPSRALGLEEGDAHIIRNAGGLAKDALRSLIISEQLLGTREIVILHHTDCGMVTFKNEDVYAKVEESLGADASHIDFMPFPDLDQSVRDDIQFLKDSPLIPNDVPIRGFVYDVKTGTVREVE
jgi:carbonic anhydrase